MGVKIYSTRWCGACFRAKRFLEEHSIEFDEIDIERVEGAADQLVEWTGGKKIVPAFEINGNVMINPSISDLASALNVKP